MQEKNRDLSGQAGFSLMELLVSLIVLAEIYVVALLLFDVNSQLAKSQVQLSEMQQGLRVSQNELVRITRMGGRGPFPVGGLPNGLAVAVQDSVAAGTELAPGATDSPIVLEDTDVLRIRGVISTPMYQIDTTDSGAYTITADAGTIKVRSTTKDGIPQNLKPLEDAITDALPEAIIVVSSQDDSIYAVGELLGTSTVVDGEVTLEIDFGVPASASNRADKYLALSSGGVVPPQLTTISFVGILEEYRFYVRDEYAVDGDPTSEPQPKFSRGRFFPGTEEGHGANEDAKTKSMKGDLADNALDFQVALGLDADDDDQIAASEWVLSDPDNAAPDFTGDLFYLRMNLTLRTDRRDLKYEADELTRIENRAFTPDDSLNLREARMYRRRTLQTIVQLRNL